MKTLPLILRYHGFNYTQVLRGKRSCIYEQEVTPEIKYYEVFKLRERKERIVIFTGVDKKIEAGERWPRNEDFGEWAWSCRTLDRAMERFHELENETIKP